VQAALKSQISGGALRPNAERGKNTEEKYQQSSFMNSQARETIRKDESATKGHARMSHLVKQNETNIPNRVEKASTVQSSNKKTQEKLTHADKLL
jgi:hypothetical protein